MGARHKIFACYETKKYMANHGKLSITTCHNLVRHYLNR